MHTALTIAASEAAEHGEPAIHPYLVGVITLVILMALLLALIAIGGGREHS
jgi:hypothetical protein